jgi:hypothetical protein
MGYFLGVELLDLVFVFITLVNIKFSGDFINYKFSPGELFFEKSCVHGVLGSGIKRVLSEVLVCGEVDLLICG